MKSSFPFFVLSLSLLFSPFFGISQDRLKNIEKDIERILEATKAPGVAVAVVNRDQTIYAQGFGLRDVENNVPMDENTLLAIGSSTKAFTCAVLGQLRDEGELSFDDSPRDYVLDLSFYNDELNNNIIIQDLMSHRTGIPRHDYSWYLFPTDDRDSLLHRIEHHEPFTGLRQQWYYNNFMYLTQGVITERITGKSWEDNIRERFFAPLDMTRSNLSIDELEKESNKAIGYELHQDSIVRAMDYYHIAAMAPAGSINSSVSEMANWLKVWINGGKLREKQILPESYITEAMSSHAVITGALPDMTHPDMYLSNYGYGWMINSYRGHYRVEHGGNIDGFSASVAFYPTDSIGIVVLTNQNGSAVPSLVRNAIADKILEEEYIDWAAYYLDQQGEDEEENSADEDEDDSTEEENAATPLLITTPSHPIADYTGSYHHPGYGRFTISAHEDSLFARFKLMKFYLKHEHYDIFEPLQVSEDYGIDTTDSSPLRFNFTTNDAGEIASVKLRIEPALDHPIEFKHEPEVVELELSEIQIYEGEYEIAGATIKVYTKADGELYLFVPGQPEYQLLASGDDLFIFKDLDGFKASFNKSAEGTVTELVLHQPNGTFTAKRKG